MSSVCSTLLKLSAFIALITSVAVYYAFIKLEPTPVLELNDGQIQGVVLHSRGGKEFHGFFGIPFAKPPLGELRFESPQKSEPWKGVWDASFHRPICAQLDFLITGLKIGSEDCLYLNVFTPRIGSEGTKKLPVLVYLHGGYFHMGTPMIGGPQFFLDHEVIVVTIAYRLGVLGFLSTDDGSVRGNMGLKDQRLGLKWVQENIERFGGDKSKVTIIGESAGGASVHYHMLSESSKGLFWRAIRQSGTSLNYWTFYRNGGKKTKALAQKVGCPLNSSKDIVKCLKEVSVWTLLDGKRELKEFPHSTLARFAPTIEKIKDGDSFLTEEPIELMRSGNFSRVPVLSGYGLDEGLLHSTSIWANRTKMEEMNDWFNWAPRAFHYDPARTDVSQKLLDFYFASDLSKMQPEGVIRNLTNLFGDRLFQVGIAEAAVLERKFTTSYLYLIDHQGGFNIGSLVAFSQSAIHPVVDLVLDRLKCFFTEVILRQEYQHKVPGSAHVDEFPLLWAGPMQYAFFRSKDVEMSKSLVPLFVQFASGKDGLQFRGIDFTPINGPKGELRFMRLNLQDPAMIDEPEGIKRRRKFWETIHLEEY